jgi:endonuclease/exonuclease/phosphatase family metal-dependent hydrolase
MVSADSITRWLKDRHTKPLFLAGDLNAIPGSEEIQKLSKHWILLNDTSQATVPVNNPKRCIDYLLMMRNPHFSVNILETKVAHEPMASDHLPVWVSLSINKNN